MKQHRFLDLVRCYGVPVLTVILGLILSFSPDTATALVASVIGWALIAAGVFAGIYALTSLFSTGRIAALVTGAVLLILGIYITARPLMLANMVGRVIGVVLIIQAVNSVSRALRGSVGTGHLIVAVLTGIAGIALLLVPIALSRLIMKIIGIVLILIGVINCIDRARIRGYLHEHSQDRPDIIDADE